jgi:hypothetical protein
MREAELFFASRRNRPLRSHGYLDGSAPRVAEGRHPSFEVRIKPPEPVVCIGPGRGRGCMVLLPPDGRYLCHGCQRTIELERV